MKGPVKEMPCKVLPAVSMTGMGEVIHFLVGGLYRDLPSVCPYLDSGDLPVQGQVGDGIELHPDFRIDSIG